MAGERTSSDIQVLPAQSSVPFDSNATSAMPVTPAESSFTDKGAATPGRSNFTDKGAVTPGAESSSECRKEQPSVGAPKDRPTWKFVIIIVSLAIVVFCAAIDQAIIAPALPAIGSQFHGSSQTPWIGTAYLLTSACAAPFYGNLASIFGSKATILGALAVLAIGDAICGAAQSLIMLIVGRAIAGIGGGGLISSSLTSIVFLVPMKHLPRYQGILGGVFGLSAVGGPLLGGAFTTNASWRWCFFFKLPIVAAAALSILIFLSLPPPARTPATEGLTSFQMLKRLDWFGAATILCACLSLLLPLQLGGNDWNWDAPQTIVLLVLGALLFIAFGWRCAKTTRTPIIPMELFKNPGAAGFLVIAICLGFMFYTEEYYVPQYFQIVDGLSAAKAGIRTIPLVLSVVLITVSTGFLIPYTGYTAMPFLGSIFSSIGLGLMSTLSEHSHSWEKIVYLIFAGFGSGFVVQTTIIGLQQSVKPELIPVATSSNTFLQVMGGVFGVAMAGTIFDNRMGSCVASRAPSVDVGTLHANISSVKDLPPNVRATVQDCFTGALSDIWLALIAFSCSIFIAMAAVVFVKRRMNQAQKERKAVAQENEKDYSGSSSPAESEEGAESGEGQQIA